ncbi:MAG: hypothetical protein A2901_08070 [Elusimicrobia bacterium RIFCSPLOWO2_01_FULL_54_10]|nr:MAG: hypothetical protein A2901_08070 [Elusimicrobia bacterium RIFCSPLOWO2_01_FULL_54_10]
MKKTFEIEYKLRYGETEDWGSVCLKASNKHAAIESFATKKKIHTNEFKSYKDWFWDEGVWCGFFKQIKLLK